MSAPTISMPIEQAQKKLEEYRVRPIDSMSRVHITLPRTRYQISELATLTKIPASTLKNGYKAGGLDYVKPGPTTTPVEIIMNDRFVEFAKRRNVSVVLAASKPGTDEQEVA